MRKLIPLILIFLAFALPIYLAFKQTSHPTDHTTKTTVNYGDLIIPVISAQKAGISQEPWLNNHKWTILYYQPACFDQCVEQLNAMHRIHKATAKEQDRVQRVLVTANNTQDIPEGTFITMVDPYAEHGLAFESGSIYLVDPQGNVLMRYLPDNAEPRGILKDMERLLSASKIGMKAGG